MKVFLVGGGGFAAEIVEALAAQLDGRIKAIVGVYDDDTRLKRQPLFELPYLGTIGDLFDKPPVDSQYVLASPENAERESCATELDRLGLRPMSVIHPTASVSKSAIIEEGAYLGAFAFVGPRAVVGRHVILNVSTSVGYGACLGSFAQLSPGVRVSRFCRVGAGAFLGSNAVVAPGIILGNQAKVGAGSFVYRNVSAGEFVMGVPARTAT